MLILGQSDIFCAHNVVHFFNMIFATVSMDFFNCLVANHVTDPGSSLIEPGAVIKHSDFASHPAQACYKDVPVLTLKNFT